MWLLKDVGINEVRRKTWDEGHEVAVQVMVNLVGQRAMKITILMTAV